MGWRWSKCVFVGSSFCRAIEPGVCVARRNVSADPVLLTDMPDAAWWIKFPRK